jgi:hypothetical protein
MTWTSEQKEALWEALRPPEEPPANCQDCERRYSQCAEFAALDRPNRPYNREYCHWYLKEVLVVDAKLSTSSKGERSK